MGKIQNILFSKLEVEDLNFFNSRNKIIKVDPTLCYNEITQKQLPDRKIIDP